jgi:hypothetical protein
MSDPEVESIPPPKLLDDRSMGARVLAPKKNWQAELRERIDAQGAVDVINGIIAGKIDGDPLQLKACEIALKKTLPDLTSLALSPESDGGKIIVYVNKPNADNPTT